MLITTSQIVDILISTALLLNGIHNNRGIEVKSIQSP